MLADLMHLQNKLEKRCGFDFEKMNIEETIAYIKEHALHTNIEMSEMLMELPHLKPWKDYSTLSMATKEEMLNKAKEEFVDMFHFVLSIALALKIDYNELYKRYCDKHDINIKRQEEGY